MIQKDDKMSLDVQVVIQAEAYLNNGRELIRKTLVIGNFTGPILTLNPSDNNVIVHTGTTAGNCY